MTKFSLAKLIQHSFRKVLFSMSALVISGLFLTTLAFAWTTWQPGAAPTTGPEGGNVSLGSTTSYWTPTATGIEYTGGGAAVVGDFAAASFWYTSDARFKTKIQPLGNMLNKILQLKPVSFEWKDTGRNDLGFIAQDIATVFPELVRSNSEGYLSVEYANLVAPLVQVVQSQQAQIDELRTELEELKANL
jgi:hypothetical protein